MSCCAVRWRCGEHHASSGLLRHHLQHPRAPPFLPATALSILSPHPRSVHQARSSAHELLNPPASTRPPPLTVPQRKAIPSTFQYLFQLGKGYLRFYKDGLKAVWHNHKLLRERLARIAADDQPSLSRPHHVPRAFSRADWVLLWRVRHDLLRLPFFGLMLIFIGEFTALVVLYVDGVVPYTCRIPKKIFTGMSRAETRRSHAFEELVSRYPHGALSSGMTAGLARTHVLKSLDLAGSIWDRVGFMPPGLWQLKGKLRMAYLEGDDRKLVEHGALDALEGHELRIACMERGIDVLGRDETALRGWLSDWLRLTAAESIEERRRRMATLLLTRPDHWPQQRDFALPAWEL